MRGFHTLKPDYDKWASTPTWTVEETCLLIRGIEPSLLDIKLLSSVLCKGNDFEEDLEINEKLISHLARQDKKIECGLMDHVDRWGLLLNLRNIYYYFAANLGAGEYNHDERTENGHLPPDIVYQAAFDESGIFKHDFFKDHLKQIGFKFRYSERSNMFCFFKLFFYFEILKVNMRKKNSMRCK